MNTRSGRNSKRKSESSFLDTSPKKSRTKAPVASKSTASKPSAYATMSAAMNKKLDSILAGIGVLTGRMDHQEQRLDVLTGGHISVDDSEAESEMESDALEIIQEVAPPPPPPSRRPSHNQFQPQAGSSHKGKGPGKNSQYRGRGGARGGSSGSNQTNHAHPRGQNHPYRRPRGGQNNHRGQNRGRGEGHHMSQSFRSELKRMMRQEILDEQYQGERCDRQLIIYGEPSGEYDSKQLEKSRAYAKLIKVMVDLKPEDIEQVERFNDPHIDGAYPMIVTFKRKMVVARILDFLEDVGASTFPWLDQSRTREVRRRNARINKSIDDLNEELSKANSATLWEQISAGPLSARRRIPNPNYKPTQKQLATTSTMNKRPKSSQPVVDQPGTSGTSGDAQGQS